MAILCGTDFSPRAQEAADVAAALAARLDEPLLLVHAREDGATRIAEADDDLCAEADRLRQRFPGLSLTPRLEAGLADEVLAALAGDPALRIRMAVVASVGRRGVARWLVGSIAERTVQSAPVPVLVVREEEPWRAWLAGARPLRVLVADDLGATGSAALDAACGLATIAPCELVVCHLVDEQPPPPESEAQHLARLAHQLERRLADAGWPGTARLRVEGGYERRPHALVRLATDECADLLLLGTRQLGEVRALWEESVSRGVLLHATGCTMYAPAQVPARAPAAKQPPGRGTQNEPSDPASQRSSPP
jgi:nucleotide-binding universal stress UspA family protein